MVRQHQMGVLIAGEGLEDLVGGETGSPAPPRMRCLRPLPLADLHERDFVRVLDAVATDLADTGLPDETHIDSVLPSCVQLSLSTPTAPAGLVPPRHVKKTARPRAHTVGELGSVG